MSWLFGDDITWCVSECDNTECFRNIKNRKRISETHDIFTCADLKDTEYCPLVDEEK